jgi:hypothetical protein
MLDEVVTKLVDAQFQPRVPVQPKGKMGGQLVAQRPVRLANNPDAHQLLQDGVASVMKKDLTASQWSLYEIERGKRDEHRKSMTIRYFLDAIDRELYLSPDQRDRLDQSLSSNWDTNWTLYLENHLYGNRFYPMTIDPLVTPVLTDPQKEVWKGVQKVGVYWGFAGMLGGFANDADGLEIELGEAVKPADANQLRLNRLNDLRARQQMQIELQQVDIQERAAAAATVKVQTKSIKGLIRKDQPQPKPAAKVEKTKD